MKIIKKRQRATGSYEDLEAESGPLAGVEKNRRKQQVAPEITATLAKAVADRTRSIFLVIGDVATIDAVIYLHTLLSTAKRVAAPTVTWAYSKELLFGSVSTGRRRKARAAERVLLSQGVTLAGADSHADLAASAERLDNWLAVTPVTYVYYAESSRVLGSTTDMLILQDIDALTPNTLARTVETVAGGGVVLLLCHKMRTLRDVAAVIGIGDDAGEQPGLHSDGSSAGRLFGQRLLHSLSHWCPSFLAITTDFALIPLSQLNAATGGTASPKQSSGAAKRQPEAAAAGRAAAAGSDLLSPDAITVTLTPDAVMSKLLSLCVTKDQAAALLAVCARVLTPQDGPLLSPPAGAGAASATKQSTKQFPFVLVTAARGRGKSAAVGLAAAAAVLRGAARITVVAPWASSAGAVFEFLLRGLVALGHKISNLDSVGVTASCKAGIEAAAVQADGYVRPKFGTKTSSGGTIGVTVDSDHHIIHVAVSLRYPVRIVFCPPPVTGPSALPFATDPSIATADLLIIDEAAAIPLPAVEAMLAASSCPAILATTTSGYEGTGRGLTSRLIDRLSADSNASSIQGNTVVGHAGSRISILTLTQGIRYFSPDPVEEWLIRALVLDPPLLPITQKTSMPHPRECSLWHVNRAALFSSHEDSEIALKKIWGVASAAHYQLQPDDLQLIADAPAHHLFVLSTKSLLASTLSSQPSTSALVVVHAAEEGGISPASVTAAVRGGLNAASGVMPMVFSRTYGLPGAAALRGLRIVHIATHPSLQSMGYGERALQLLTQWAVAQRVDYVASTVDLPLFATTEEASRFRTNGQPFEYLGALYPLSARLHKFWTKMRFVPVNVTEKPQSITGEHSCLALNGISKGGDVERWRDQHLWITYLQRSFQQRFVRLLSGECRNLPVGVALSMLAGSADPLKEEHSYIDGSSPSVGPRHGLTQGDVRRLHSFCNRLTDVPAIMDLVPVLAIAYFQSKFGRGESVDLHAGEAVVLFGLGLQRRSMEQLACDPTIGMSRQQLVPLLIKGIQCLLKCIQVETLPPGYEQLADLCPVLKKATSRFAGGESCSRLPFGDINELEPLVQQSKNSERRLSTSSLHKDMRRSRPK